MTERDGKQTSALSRATARVGKALAAVLSLPRRGVVRLGGWLGRSKRWRWALGGTVLVALLAAAWVSVVPWASYLQSGPQGLELGDGWLGWDWIDTGESAATEQPGDDAALTPVDPSLIPVDRVPVPQQPPATEEQQTEEQQESSNLSRGDAAREEAMPAVTVPLQPAGPDAGESAALSEEREEEGWGEQAAASALAGAGAVSGPAQRVDPRINMRPPAEGPVVREVGWYRHPTYGDWRFYPGVEIQLRPGTPVSPALAGRVTRVEDDVRWALTVWVDHGSGWQTSYGYLREALVSPGQEIDQNTVLGISGLSPLGEPQIMFAVWKDGEPVDPSRLLP